MNPIENLPAYPLVKSSQLPAIIAADQRLTYQQTHDAVVSIACFLKALGIQETERVGIISPNSSQGLLVTLALWQIGAVVCLLNPRLPEKILDRQLGTLQCRYCLSAYPPFHFQAKTLNIANIANRRLQKPPQEQWSMPLEDEATVMFTSGVTRQAKPVLNTFANHYYSAQGSNENIPIVSSDQWLLSLPMYHVGGLSIIFRAFLVSAAVVIPGLKQSLDEAVQVPGITHVSLVPTQLFRLLKNRKSIAALRKFKTILLGGSAIPQTLVEQSIQLKLPLYISYGSTEMSSQIATSQKIKSIQDAQKVKVLKFRHVSISDSNEILVKGEVRFRGYAKGNKIIQPFNRAGWFQTGDLGKLVDEKYLTVTGRKDNMFISGGENIQPEEIERYLCQIKGIQEALVVPVKNPEFGFRPVAFIKQTEQASVSKIEMKRHLSEHLPKFKIPEKLYVYPENPDTTSLKMNRTAMKQLIDSEGKQLQEI